MLKNFLHNNRGSALVELALTTPLLMFTLIGTAELGRIAYAAIEVEGAARAGASYGALSTTNAFGPASAIEQAAKNDAPNITDLTATATTACVCETLTSSTDTPSYNPSTPISCYSSGTTLNSTFADCTTVNGTETQSVIEYVDVTTHATVATMLHYPGIPTSFTLNGFAQMRAVQN